MSDLLHTAVAGDFVAGNSLNLAVMVVVSQHTQVGNSTLSCYPNIIDFAIYCPLRDFGRKKIHC